MGSLGPRGPGMPLHGYGIFSAACPHETPPPQKLERDHPAGSQYPWCKNQPFQIHGQIRRFFHNFKKIFWTISSTRCGLFKYFWAYTNKPE